MKIYIHIGTHKTGTTYIQNYLCNNKYILNAADVLYPDVGVMQNAHHKLGGSLIHGLGLNVWGGGGNKFSRISDIPVWRQIKLITERCRKEKLIISTEEFEWLTEPAVIKDYLPEHDFKIIVYLRKQDSYLSSLYQTLVSDYPIRLSKAFDNWLHELSERNHIYNYNVLVNRWSGAFGKEAMKIKIFEKEIAIGLNNSICNSLDFLPDLSGAMVIHEQNWDQRRRESMDIRCLEILRIGNAIDLPLEEHKKLHRSFFLLSERIKKSDAQMNKTYESDALHNIMKHLDPLNNQLAQEYLGVERLFD